MELTAENTLKTGSVVLTKVDTDNNNPLKDVSFELYKGEELIGTYVTDENGIIVINNLSFGKYHFVEVKTNDNYILDNDKVMVNISFMK